MKSLWINEFLQRLSIFDRDVCSNRCFVISFDDPSRLLNIIIVSPKAGLTQLSGMIKNKQSPGELKTAFNVSIDNDNELISIEYSLKASSLRLCRNKIQECSLCIILSAKYR